MLQSPVGDERTITHVSLFYLVALLDADALGEQTIHQIGIVLCLVSLVIRSQAKLHQLVVGDIIESKQVGTCFLYRIAVCLERIRVGARQELSTSMTQTLMQVGMKVVGDVAILIDEVDGLCIDDKLITEAITLGRLVVRLGQVADGDSWHSAS